jgi:hypothetical protein
MELSRHVLTVGRPGHARRGSQVPSRSVANIIERANDGDAEGVSLLYEGTG